MVGVLVFALAAQGGLSIFTGASLNARVDDEAEIWMPRLDTLQELVFDLVQLRVRHARHILARDPAAKARVDRQIAEIVAKIDTDRQAYETLTPPGVERKAYDQAMSHLPAYWKLHEKLIALSRTGATEEATAILNAELKPSSDAVLNGVRDALSTARAGAKSAYADARTAYTVSLVITVLVLLGGLAAGAGVAHVIANRVIRPIDELTDEVETLAGGNLKHHIRNTDREDEIGILARGLAQFRESLIKAEELRREQQATEARLRASQHESDRAHREQLLAAEHLRTSREHALKSLRVAAEMIGGINDITVDLSWLDVSTREVTRNAEMIAAAAVEMATSVEHIARNSEGAANDASAADQTVTIGRDAIDKVASAILNIAQVFEETAASVDGLATASEQIGNILGVIEGIAAQTNLLALNASIEAARAGEAGRGFAVVAQEVKALANQTTNATDDIAQRINSLRAGMTAILKTMNLSRTAVSEGQEAIGSAASTMEQIAAQVGNVSNKMQEISGILTQQNAAAAEISANIDRVANTAKANEGRLRAMGDMLHDNNRSFAASATEWHDATDPRSICEIAKIDHIMFKKRVVDAISGRGEWSVAEIPDHHACRLGKWYDGIRDAQIRALPSYMALVEPHRRVHAAAKTVLEAQYRHDRDATMDGLNELNDASREVLKLLSALSSAMSAVTVEAAQPVPQKQAA